MQFGIYLVSTDSMESFDARGFHHDIIVDPKRAPELIAKCMEYYSIR